MTNEEGPKNSLGEDISWAARESRVWFITFFRSPGNATGRMSQGIRSEPFKAKAARWHASMAMTIGGVRLTAPVLVAASVAIYYALSQHSFIDSLAAAALAGILTFCAVRVLPFAIVIGIPILGLFILFRFFAAINLPEPPTDDTKLIAPVAPKSEDEPSPGPQPAPPAQEPQDPKPVELDPERETQIARLPANDRPLLRRLLESRDVFQLHDDESLAIVQRWVDAVRSAQDQFDQLESTYTQHLKLDTLLTRPMLLELGLLDGSSYEKSEEKHQNFTELERIEAAFRPQERGRIQELLMRTSGFAVEIFADGSNDAMSREENEEPEVPEGKVLLLSPVHHGYLILEPSALNDIESPRLTCDVAREIVHRYVKATGHTEIAESWRVITTSQPNLRSRFLTLNNGRDINLKAVEDAILARSVGDSTARLLADFYSAYLATTEELEAHVSHRKRVAALVQHTLEQALRQLHTADAKAREARIAARRSRTRSPYADSFPDRTPVKTRDQRRAEIATTVYGAIPRKRRDW